MDVIKHVCHVIYFVATIINVRHMKAQVTCHESESCMFANLTNTTVSQQQLNAMGIVAVNKHQYYLLLVEKSIAGDHIRAIKPQVLEDHQHQPLPPLVAEDYPVVLK